MWWLKYLNNQQFLMDEAGGAGGGGQGGGQSGDPLFDGAGAGGNAGGANGGGNGGSAQNGGQGGSGNGGNAGNGGGQSNQKITIPENWKDALADDVKALPQASKYKTVDELVKAHAHLEKTLGAERIAVPQKGTPLEQMRDVFEKLGVPKELKDYNVELDPNIAVDKDFFGGFKEVAHKLGVLPQQAKALTEWFADLNNKSIETQEAQIKAQADKELNDYKTELGDAWDENVAKAKAALKEFASEEDAKWIREVGLGRNPRFLRLLAKAGEGLSEGKIRGEGGNGGSGKLTPQQALEKINSIKQNFQHPYWQPGHAENLKAKEEMAQLHKWAYPDQTPIKPINEQSKKGGGVTFSL